MDDEFYCMEKDNMQLEITNQGNKITLSGGTNINISGNVEEKDIDEAILFIKRQLEVLQGFRIGYLYSKQFNALKNQN